MWPPKQTGEKTSMNQTQHIGSMSVAVYVNNPTSEEVAAAVAASLGEGAASGVSTLLGSSTAVG
ncbi:MAG: hypothetical protein C4523_17725 [Myxococcales bacterium]|nr:MAG: hypothetical protein C4523_17725 [Myxococcales bacterium]